MRRLADVNVLNNTKNALKYSLYLELDRWVPKFRYEMSKSMPKGTVNPVNFDQLVHNEYMEYHNGVVFIMQPGYYTFTVQARNGVKGRELALYILIENRRVALGKR